MTFAIYDILLIACLNQNLTVQGIPRAAFAEFCYMFVKQSNSQWQKLNGHKKGRAFCPSDSVLYSLILFHLPLENPKKPVDRTSRNVCRHLIYAVFCQIIYIFYICTIISIYAIWVSFLAFCIYITLHVSRYSSNNFKLISLTLP